MENSNVKRKIDLILGNNNQAAHKPKEQKNDYMKIYGVGYSNPAEGKSSKNNLKLKLAPIGRPQQVGLA